MLEVQDSSKITQVGRARLLLRVFSDSPPSPPKASHTIFQQGVLWVPHLRRTSSVSNQTLQDPKNLLNHRWAVATRHALEHASLGHWCNISTDSGLLHDFKISFILVGILSNSFRLSQDTPHPWQQNRSGQEYKLGSFILFIKGQLGLWSYWYPNRKRAWKMIWYQQWVGHPMPSANLLWFLRLSISWTQEVCPSCSPSHLAPT